ncbi:amidohydrolase family protein [Prosthecobacter fusiformis]|uniref:Amidohydrolase family protein n=1 Tax=Prosthecobacter fusiformis TaxID=48464 RepID=A0A4R7RMB8_9BACT|nr:amidohydrolase family protein [Prosthecobacter fusiformis]TDU66462.1 amidohydrolase family protein [Prosthecobacter fusiformis]
MLPSTSRRAFLSSSLASLAATAMAQEKTSPPGTAAPEPVIDIHQHTHFHQRGDDHLLAHQQAMGITTTILLPAGTPTSRPSTHEGRSNGLGAQCLGTETCRKIAQDHPGAYLWGANEVTDQDTAPAEIEKWLKLGACIIGEQKFDVECDSSQSQKLYELAAAYHVPILMHFQNERYNRGYERLHTMLAKYPQTTFIGHAQTFWGNIDKHHQPKDLYPKGKITPGGLTDRFLADYPNFFADMSAGSGLNALTRDEEHTTAFFQRHQDKILYGSDCADHFGRGPGCQGAQTIAMIRKLSPTQAIERKILFANAQKLFRLG